MTDIERQEITQDWTLKNFNKERSALPITYLKEEMVFGDKSNNNSITSRLVAFPLCSLIARLNS